MADGGLDDDGSLLPSFTVVRPDDLAVLTFRLHNLVVARDGEPRLVRADPSSEAFLTVELAPQAFGEEAFAEDVPGFTQGPEAETAARRPPPPPGGVAIRLARRSRLVFAVPGDDQGIGWSLEGLLEACRRLPPRTAAVGAEPGQLHTAVEVPYGLVLAPGSRARWHHAPAPEAHRGRVALWQTRLEGEAPPEGGPTGRPLVGFVTRGLDTIRPENDPADFPTTLGSQAVKDLVAYGDTSALATFEAERLMLSPLGAWFAAGVEFDRSRLPESVQATTALVSWAHRTTMGRDHHVRTVEEGYLFPFGHRAARITVSQRKLDRADEASPAAAYLRQRTYVLVLQRERGFEGEPSLPFRKVRVLTAVTPDLQSPTASAIAGQGQKAFWPTVAPGHDAVFELEAEDRSGARVTFVAPLAFVGTAVDRNALAAWMGEGGDGGYLSAAPEARARRELQLGGQPIAFAEGRSGRTDSDSTFETAVVELGATARPGSGAGPPFSPLLRRAVSQLPAVRALTGLTGEEATVTFSYHPRFLEGQDHPLDVFGRVVVDQAGTPMAPIVEFPSPEQGGGLVAPRLAVTSLSRTFGPVGGKPGDLDAGTFRPADVFGELPRLLGTLRLTDLLQESISLPSLDQALRANPGAPRMPRLVSEGPGVSHLRWEARREDLAVRGEAVPVFAWSESSLLSVDVVRRPPGGPEPESTATSRLVGFSVQLPSREHALVEVPFDVLEFTATSGRKPDVSVEVGDVRFLGPLSFVNALARLIPPAGFQDPPALEVTAGGIRAGYTLAVPTLAFGVFNLQNLALSAGFHLPLVSDTSPASLASLRVAFSERENPCLLTVSAFGGAAFLAIDVGLRGLNSLEGSLEFGGAVAMSIGVASGGITVMAGVYYAWQPGMSALSAFLRCNGVLEVLGIVSISAAFYLALTWTGSKLSGSATLVVKVKVLFVSKSVALTVTREFAGSPAPSFTQAVARDEWKAYLAAFAPEGQGS